MSFPSIGQQGVNYRCHEHGAAGGVEAIRLEVSSIEDPDSDAARHCWKRLSLERAAYEDLPLVLSD